MVTVVASLKRISLESVFFRHVIDEDRLISIMAHVIKTGKWDLPPPLVVRQSSDGLRYFWVLDGHHRVSAARLFENTLKKPAKIWAFVVSEREYATLLHERFNGAEPDSIRDIRQHIVTPFGDGNSIDDIWGGANSVVSERVSATLPVFVFEKDRHSLANIGFFTAGFSLDGRIWIKDSKSQRTVLKMKRPPSFEQIEEKHTARLKMDHGDDIEIDLSTRWNYRSQRAELQVETKGIRLLVNALPGISPGRPAKSVIIEKEGVYNQSKLIMSVLRRINTDFSNINIAGMRDDQREAPWYLLDEFPFVQPNPMDTPEPKDIKPRIKEHWSRRRT